MLVLHALRVFDPRPCASAVRIGALSSDTLQIDFRTGVSATDWNAIAKKEHLDALTIELRKLEDSIREVYSEMLLLQQRESEMREISGMQQGMVITSSIHSQLRSVRQRCHFYRTPAPAESALACFGLTVLCQRSQTQEWRGTASHRCSSASCLGLGNSGEDVTMHPVHSISCVAVH